MKTKYNVRHKKNDRLESQHNSQKDAENYIREHEMTADYHIEVAHIEERRIDVFPHARSKKNMKKILLTCLVVYSVVFLTACPNPKTIEKAKNYSGRVAAFADEGVNITRELFRSGVLKPDQAREITKKFIVLADGGIVFDALVREMEKTYATGAPPRSELDKLFAVFSRDVVAAFTEVLKSLKISDDVGKYGVAVDLIKTAVLTIARAFSREKEIRQQIEAVA